MQVAYSIQPKPIVHAAGAAPAAGTLLQLVWSLEGDEQASREALHDGYRLTGNFRGREADVLEDPPRSQ